MKKKIALLLVLIMLLMTAVSCGSISGKGAIIPMYLTSAQSNLDPAAVIYDKDTMQYLSLLYEGLVTMTEDGEIEEGIAEEWYTEEEDGEICVYFRLRETRWNDKVLVTADNFVYAWQRILTPSFQSPAAPLLYDIKNAKKVKSGELTVADLGVTAVENGLLRIVLEKDIELSLLLENLASPALGPLRDDIVEGSAVWSSSAAAFSANGPFAVKRLTYKTAAGQQEATSRDPDAIVTEICLERNAYYYSELDEDNPAKYVTPHRLLTDYENAVADAMEKFESGDIFYIGSFTKDTYNAVKDDVVTAPLLSTGTLFFNCKNDLFSDASVRAALSQGLDRNAIAEIVGLGAKAATAFVPESVFDDKTEEDSSFRQHGGALYSFDSTAAKNALKGKNGSFEITYRKANATHKAVAEEVAKQWSKLGFGVKAKALSNADYEAALSTGAFDVLMLDYQGLSSSAYSFLAPFARYYSGNSVDVRGELFTPHVTGYESDKYDAAVDAVLNETTRKARAEKLHEVEKLLCKDAPAIALYFNYNAYLASDRLDGVTTDVFGCFDFNEVELEGYEEVIEALGE